MTWFANLFGFEEQTYAHTQKMCSVEGETLHIHTLPPRAFQLGSLTTPTLAELRQQAHLARPHAPLSVHNLVADAHFLHTRPEAHGALIQVASQFNLLEMPGPTVTPERGIAGYINDRTQGPACALACAPATLYRNYLAPIDGQPGQTSHRQINTLQGVLQALGTGGIRMQNGYAMAPASAVRAAAQHLQALSETATDQLRQLLRIGLQSNTQVTARGAPPGQKVTQAFCSALPVAYNDTPHQDWKPLALLVLEASYEATLLAAVVNWQTTGNPRVYLTAVGGGAFGNDRAWILQAMRRALRAVSHFPLQVHVVSHRDVPADLARLAQEFLHPTR